MHLLLTLITALIVAGCGVAPSVAPSASKPASPTPAPTLSAASTAVPSPGAIGHAALLVCSMGERCDAEPGTFVTDAEGFFPGLEIKMPAGWFFTEQDAGELALHPSDDPDKTVVLVKDVRVIASTRESGPYNEIVEEVDPTAEAFAEWFTNNDAFTVLEEPQAAAIAGTSGTAFTIAVSETANYGDAECPSNPRCADLFRDPVHWGDNNFSIGGPTPIRLYVADVKSGSRDHLFVIAWDGGPASELDAWVARTMPILDSTRLPAQYVSN